MNVIPFAGWERNAKIVCNDMEVVVTLEVGPRVIFFGFTGGANEFVVHESEAGVTGGDEFRSYGGHRLWIAPEEPLRTLRPDNVPVDYTRDEEFHVFTSPADEFHIQKQIRIKADTENNRFVIVHRILNQGAYPLEMAAWAPTQCSGGTVLFPQPPFQPHSERLLPTRPLVMWGYTRLQDPRWTWGDTVVKLRHDSDMGPTKIGALIEQGYAACANHGNVFLKRFPYVSGATYPDYNSNFESFTRHDMLEIETLGPLVTVGIGDYVEHQETWYLIKDQTPPDDDTACGNWLADLASARPL
ncbi:MAG: hypothetical protein P4L46_21320 [Fimbriimonas sp.]|nr:hypothetical protein [Fimbriimonas sp.]